MTDPIYQTDALIAEDIEAYLEQHRLPRNPLRLLGYTSVGCFPCTRPTGSGEDARAGRWWRLAAKTECGLHDPFASDRTGEG